jgi:ferredoxin-type protein NapG
MSKDGKGVSRRELLTFWRKPLEELKKKPPPPPPPSTRPPPLRPPGMLHELMLVSACQRCGKCVEACPADAIFPLGPEWGEAKGTPAIDARQQPCVLCDGLKCTHVCPSNALLPVYANKDVQMGWAVLDVGRCVTYLGQACDVCHKACPMPGAILVEEGGRVRVEEGRCVGCGVCESVCPVEPTAIRVQPRD